MKQCVKCVAWWPNDKKECAICGETLQTQEYSSEDADDGLFIDDTHPKENKKKFRVAVVEGK